MATPSLTICVLAFIYLNWFSILCSKILLQKLYLQIWNGSFFPSFSFINNIDRILLRIFKRKPQRLDGDILSQLVPYDTKLLLRMNRNANSYYHLASGTSLRRAGGLHIIIYLDVGFSPQNINIYLQSISERNRGL